MESSTKILRRLLDERGVEYDLTDRLSNIPSYQSVTWWFNTADKAEFREYHDGSTQLIVLSSIVHATPEQAIEATLGRGTCHDIGDTSDFCCSECGARMFIDTGETYTMIDSLGNIIEQPNFCPNCGRRIKED